MKTVNSKLFSFLVLIFILNLIDCSKITNAIKNENMQILNIDPTSIGTPNNNFIYQPFDFAKQQKFVFNNNLNFLNRGILIEKMNSGPQSQMPFNTMYNFSDQPKEFLIKTEKIDYDIIKRGIERSRILSEQFNFFKTKNPPCSKCIGVGVFCECDDIYLPQSFEESPPILMPLIHPISETGSEKVHDDCEMLETCLCKGQPNCDCSCPCKCVKLIIISLLTNYFSRFIKLNLIMSVLKAF